MAPKFTAEEIRKGMEDAEVALVAAKKANRGKRNAGKYLGKAIMQLVAQARVLCGETNVTFTAPCGSQFKVVCMHDARAKAAKAAKRAKGAA